MTFCQSIGTKAVRALLTEAAAAPKPGLVDRFGSGSHEDMDIFTFMDSAAVLGPHFTMMAQAGAETAHMPKSVLLGRLRRLGKAAEEHMLAVTGGVNTHRGAIFALGLLCGAAGAVHTLKGCVSARRICEFAAEMCVGITGELRSKDADSHGGLMYLKYGAGGARAQAETGYRDCLEIYLPYMRSLESQGADINERCLRTLLLICNRTDDTTVLWRAGESGLRDMKQRSGELLESFSISAAFELDEYFTARRISPGGCADLLAVTVFLDLLSK